MLKKQDSWATICILKKSHPTTAWPTFERHWSPCTSMCQTVKLSDLTHIGKSLRETHICIDVPVTLPQTDDLKLMTWTDHLNWRPQSTTSTDDLNWRCQTLHTLSLDMVPFGQRRNEESEKVKKHFYFWVSQNVFLMMWGLVWWDLAWWGLVCFGEVWFGEN